MDQFKFFLNLAFDHVLDWQAYDHILFFIVLAVIYAPSDWKKVLGLISLFTVGHTVTLGLATYDIVSIDSELVEFLIPLTIFITALANAISGAKKKFNSSNMNLIFAFFFGLIHGLGLSGFLKMTLDDSEDKLIPLFEFALGVELAQILIVILILACGVIAQKIFKIKKRDWILVVSSGVMGIVLQMIFERKIW